MSDISIQYLEHLELEALGALAQSKTAQEFESWRITYLGRKGIMPILLRGIKDLPETERIKIGKKANELRRELEEKYEQKKITGEFLSSEHGVDTKRHEPAHGHIHPISLTIRRLIEIFSSMGFLIVEGPELEQAKYNFDQLNITLEHPARSLMDTFYIEHHPDLVLRTHVSPLQVRAVIENDLKPPFRFMYYDRCFRHEKVDASHENTFHQFEYIVVSQNITIADLKGITDSVYSTFFGRQVKIRFRPSYFPFVEPGLEVDMSCVFCNKGCRVCKFTTWIEMAGAGMVHPNVLRNMNVDPKKWQGIAMGAAIDRLAMLWYRIDDIRLFWSGDIRFLEQFS